MREADVGQSTEITKTPPPATAHQAAIALEPPQPLLPPAPPAAKAGPSLSAPVVITIGQRQSEPPVAPQSAAMPRDRDGIGRELQKELKRVGCYEGELNGAWTTSTRQAMKAFTDRVNASLPTDEPDGILLTMVRGYQDKVCAKPCPAGQGMSDGGRCVPNAILVRVPTKPSVPAAVAAPAPNVVPAITGWTTTTTAAAPPLPGAAPGEGRMALAGPPRMASRRQRKCRRLCRAPTSVRGARQTVRGAEGAGPATCSGTRAA
jgi:hypothetical protein